jgi:tetratricopeptide (TPR) repeat protein
VARLAELGKALADPKFQWWIDQVEIQRLAAAAWLARAEGRPEAEALLRAAVALESEAGTHPVTPGQILPASEQLGDLLMELDRPAEALVEYQRSLAAFPQRFNSHDGAARAAERAGKHDVARLHYEQIVAMAGDGDGLRDELERARAFLDAR